MPRIPTPRSTSKALAYLGSGLALAGAGAGIASSGFAASPSPAAAVVTGAAVHATNAEHASAVAAKPAVHRQAPEAVVVHSAKKAKVVRHTVSRHVMTWAAVQGLIAEQTQPRGSLRPLPAADKLTPAGTSGQQSWMPITQSRYDNARTITQQALRHHMGLRSAVVAVATAMQESTLENINYGTSDSLGLFQQRPSCGWGTPAQIMTPRYAADAFLRALRGYESSNPSWASQPLWQTAQGVQGSAYPSAYAKWEAQAAHLVQTIAQRSY